MKIGIMDERFGFGVNWVKYCTSHNLDFKTFNSCDSDIISKLKDCDGILWHWSQDSHQSPLFARQLIYSLEQAGKIVFPNFHTIWHFDDKVGQKYLLEVLGAPLVKSYSFYDYKTARQWISETEFPKVFKLRGGAGSSNVKLVRNQSQALRLARKMFSSGISRFDKWEYLRESLRKWHEKKAPSSMLLNAVAHLAIAPKGARMLGTERGYLYFQDFIPDNAYDIRIIVIGNRAISLKRWCRDNDFRASGSGRNDFSIGKQSEECAEISFRIASCLKTQSCAFDFVFQDGKPLIVEISYGFSEPAYFDCLGFWDKTMHWHDEPVRPSEWILEDMLSEYEKQKAAAGTK